MYYPFSRCINNDSLKQMLLLFENITFLDPVTDDDWRANLMRDMELEEDPRFERYINIHEPLKDLRSEGLIKIIDPSSLSEQSKSIASVSAISDLLDESWRRSASEPAKYKMPYRQYSDDGSPTWKIFKPKVPDIFVDALDNGEFVKKHLIDKRTEQEAWTLSYEAGSAISTSIHLAAAEELKLAPITDSTMHHQLLVTKSMRSEFDNRERAVPLPESAIASLANQTAISLVNNFLPQNILQETSFDKILRFREDTKSLRHHFISDLEKRFSILKSEPTLEHLYYLQREVSFAISKEVALFQNELAGAKFNIWPNLVSSLNKSLATGSAAAVGFNLFGGAGYTLSASLLAASLTFLKGTLDIKGEVDKASRSTSPSACFLSKVANP